jgi:hypothetical protein
MISYLCYDNSVKKIELPIKVVDETTEVRCSIGQGIMREEVWQDSAGNVVKYNLAFVNHSLCAKDNGRVLGYDNSHGEHHRHYMGRAERFTFTKYRDVLSRFFDEVRKLRK